MKQIIKYFFLMICLIACSEQISAQSPLSRIEYFIDSDPGMGNGHLLTLSSLSNDTSVTFLLQTQSLALGMHTLFVRALDNTGNYSLVQRSSFFVLPNIPNLSAVEYFVDADPGVGNGQQIPLSSNSTDTTLSFTINTASVSNGLHTLFVRAKNTAGQYSVMQQHNFYVSPILPNLAAAEYFVDADPGVGNGQQIPISSNSTDTTLSFAINTASVSNGLHTLFVRAKNTAGQYSVMQQHNFYVLPITPNLSMVEYFIDSDPGIGNGQTFAIAPSTSDTSIITHINTSSLPAGFHNLYARVKNQNNQWSVVQSSFFYHILSPAKPNILEYYIDNDPGFGNGNPVTFTNGTDTAVASFTVNLNGISIGSHHLYLRAKDSSGHWGVLVDSVFCKNPGADFTVPSIVCAGQTFTLTNTSTDTTNTTTYAWDIGNDGSIDRTGKDTIQLHFSDTGFQFIKLKITTPGTCANDSIIKSIYVGNSLSLTASIQASTTSTCAGNPIRFVATPVNGGLTPTFQWLKNGIDLSGATDDTLEISTLSDRDTITCIVNTSLTSCILNTSVVSNKIGISITPLVTPAIVLSASSSAICPGESVNFTTTITNGGTAPQYAWFKNNVQVSGQSGTSFALHSIANNDSVFVRLTSSIGCTSSSTVSSNSIKITVNPITPATITASGNSFCPGASLTLNATSGTGLTYQWMKDGTLITGAISITHHAIVAGNYRSILTNASGCRDTSSVYAVTQNTLPSLTLSLHRDTIICHGNSLLIKADTTGLSSYTYQWLRNGNTVTGAIANSYTAITSGIYKLRITHTQNGCAKTSDSLSLTVNSLPILSVTGNAGLSNFCKGDTVTMSASASSGLAPYVFHWTHNSSNSQTGNTYKIVQAGTYRGFVTDSIGCKDSSALFNFSFTNKTLANFSIPSNVCSGQLLTLTNTSSDTTNTTTYKWDIDNNGNIDRTRKDTIQLYNPDSGFRSIKLVATTPGVCAPDSVTKSVYTNFSQTVSVTISAPATHACSGTAMLFIATAVNGGTNPVFQWRVNGTAIAGATDDSLSIISLNDKDTITCWVTTSLTTCVANLSALSNKIGIRITPTVIPFIVITSGTPFVCAGSAVTFSANVVNAGSNPIIAWYKNSVLVAGQNGNTYSLSNPSVNDTVYATLMGSGNCVSTGLVVSNKIGVAIKNITPAIVSATSASFCSGGSTKLMMDTSAGSTYRWMLEHTIQSSTHWEYDATLAGNYRGILTNNFGCVDTSAVITITANPLPVILLNQPADTSFCEGSSFILTVDSNMTGSATYLWKRNMTALSELSNELTVTQSGSYAVMVTSTVTGCMATSSPVSITTIMPPAVALNISGTIHICKGTSAQLAANSGTDLSYQWYNGATEITDATNRMYATSEAGIYRVLVSNTTTHCSKLSDSVSVIVNPKPTLNITGNTSQTNYCINDSIQLTGQATTGTAPFNYTWLNNNTLLKTDASLTISQTGNYRLVAMDSLGCRDSSASFTYTFNNNPVANITVTGNLNYCQPIETLTLTADTAVGNSYTWYKSDYDPTNATTEPDTIAATGTSSISNPNWGNYTVEVLSSTGCKSLSNPVMVKGYTKPTATLSSTAAQTICGGQPIQLSLPAATFGSVNSLLQNDSIYVPINNDSTVLLFSSGTYRLVSYIPGIDGCSDTSSTSFSVTVKESPSAKIGTENAQQCLTDNLFIFYPENALQNPESTVYTYLFGDGQTKVQPATDHKYAASGKYNVTLIATNEGNCSDTGTIEVKLGEQPVASIMVNNPVLCEGSGDFMFTNTGTPGDSNTSVLWKMGDGSLLTGNSFTHQYKQAGEYTVSILSTSVDGCSAEDSIRVELNAQPKAKFDYNIVGSSVGFMNQSSIAAGSLNYNWNLGNGDVSIAQTFTYNYAQAGVYVVGLTATSDKGCIDSTSKNITVTLDPITLYLPFFPSAGGAFYTAGGYTLSSTIGELTMVQTFMDTLKPIVLTQGFQQPDDFFNIISGLDDQPKLLHIDKGSFSFYPNPSNGPLYMGYEFTSSGQVTSVLYDQLGRLVVNLIDEAYTSGPVTQSFDLSTYKDGIYYIRTVFRGDAETIHTQKLIITH